MRKIKLIIILFANQIIYSQFSNQNFQTLTVNSPNASNLGTYGDLPVDLSTGAVNIIVPVANFQEKDVNLNIDLQHNSRGVKVADIPGWVGQNWSLNAGGVITRSVRGTSFDELDISGA